MTRKEIAELIEAIVRKYERHDDWLIDRHEPPLPEPTAEEWAALEAKFGCKFPQGFVHFMDLMSAYHEPQLLEVAERDDPGAGDPIAAIYDTMVAEDEWPSDLIPFEGAAGSYYCLSAAAGPHSPVFYVDDDVVREECAELVATSFDEWLKNIETHLGGELAGIAPEDVPDAPFDRETSARLRTAFSVSTQWFSRPSNK
jgi:SMI1 / KNR4 family (SUKH-1)